MQIAYRIVIIAERLLFLGRPGIFNDFSRASFGENVGVAMENDPSQKSHQRDMCDNQEDLGDQKQSCDFAHMGFHILKEIKFIICSANLL